MPRTPAKRPKRDTADLLALAKVRGIHTRYTDGLGQKRTPPVETLIGILRALGHDIRSPADAAKAHREFDRRRSKRICEPVIIAWRGIAPPLALNLPPRARTLEWSLKLEDGGGEYRATESVGRGGPGLQLPLMPMGIHTLLIEAAGVQTTATVLSAPSRCFQGDEDGPQPRELGIFLPLYALRSRRSWGTGDLSDLDALTTWAGSLGCNLVGTLPLLSCYLDEPFNPSPYSPISRLHFNELFADVTAAPEFRRSAPARRLASSAAFKRTIDRLRKADFVDYRQAYRAKRRVIQHLARTAYTDPARRQAIEDLLRQEPTLDDYARFRAAADRRRSTWQNWPARPRSGHLTTRDFEHNDYRTHIYAQFLMREQLAEQSRLAARRGGRLYLDLPLGADGGGYDLWRFRDHFAPDLTVGAPPDQMFTHGQNWGFPPPHPEDSRRLGHAYFAAAIRNHLRFAGALRIDHVAGLHRLFCIPQGMEGEHGTYVDYPAEEFYAILSIESHRAGARIIGENLGNVPPAITRAMRRRGLLGMWIGQFGISVTSPPARKMPRAQRSTNRKPASAPPAADVNMDIHHDDLAALNTHDIPPFAAHWKGHDADLRRHFGWLTDEQAAQEKHGRASWRDAIIHHLRARRLLKTRGTPEPHEVAIALIHALAQSDAAIVLINLEDLWGETRSQNVPGISEGYPNWRPKASRTLEQITQDRQLASIIRAAARERRQQRPGT